MSVLHDWIIRTPSLEILGLGVLAAMWKYQDWRAGYERD